MAVSVFGGTGTGGHVAGHIIGDPDETAVVEPAAEETADVQPDPSTTNPDAPEATEAEVVANVEAEQASPEGSETAEVVGPQPEPAEAEAPVAPVEAPADETPAEVPGVELEGGYVGGVE